MKELKGVIRGALRGKPGLRAELELWPSTARIVLRSVNARSASLLQSLALHVDKQPDVIRSPASRP
jgi:hypothetical protein